MLTPQPWATSQDFHFYYFLSLLNDVKFVALWDTAATFLYYKHVIVNHVIHVTGCIIIGITV